MKPGRRIAFDYGLVRIGVAVSDASGLIATPVATLQAQDSALFEQIQALLSEYDPIYLVVGQPRHLSGKESQTMQSVQSFVELLQTLSPVPVHTIDERLSTVNASAKLRSAGHDAKSSKGLIDAMAAVGILESAMERERIAGSL
jgi:putative Holliday junction resolvase